MKKLLITLSIALITISSYSQDGPEGILFASTQDANRLTQAYMNPAMKGLIYGMNNSWYHTAKVHKKFGFDISFGLNGSMIPSKDEMFTLNNLNSVNQPTGGSITSATVGGSENDGTSALVTFQESIGGVNTTYTGTFDMPGGIKEDLPFNAVPTPTFQLQDQPQHTIRNGSEVQVRIEEIDMLDDDFIASKSTQCVLKAMGELMGVRASIRSATKKTR